MREKPKTMRQAAIALGVNYRSAARWAQQGLIRLPRFSHKGKKGTPVPWTDKATQELAAIAALRDYLSMQELRRAVRFLDRAGFNPLSAGVRSFAVIDGVKMKRRLVKIVHGAGEVYEILDERNAQRILVPLRPVSNGK